MTHRIVESYRSLLGSESIDTLCNLAAELKGKKIIHVNSTKEGGGVAEILSAMLPLLQELGLDVEWRTIIGNDQFFRCTKSFHNLLQGQKSPLPDPDSLRQYAITNRENAENLKDVLQSADFVIIHDPQPLALIEHFPDRKGKWVWRCHIDLSSPSAAIWDYLKPHAADYDAAIFSMREFSQKLPCPIAIIPPSIDPLSEKNQELDPHEIQKVFHSFGIDLQRPSLLQVSRFDPFKDPLGVIEAYRLVKSEHPGLQLVLAGSGAADDPEGEAILKEVKKTAGNDPDIHILLLPPTSHRTINALQRGASIVLQKSLKEGFGLTVSEALWKSKPVIGGDCGGIRLQIIDHATGLLVNSVEEAAQAVSFLLKNPETGAEYGKKGKRRVEERFLMIRQITEELNLLKNLRSHPE